jgi:hypothetical protein
MIWRREEELCEEGAEVVARGEPASSFELDSRGDLVDLRKIVHLCC